MSNEKYIIDYVSGEKVSTTPEEVESVQVFSKILVEDYSYPKSHIQTRPQFRVKKSPSDTSKGYPVDIAVFGDSSKSEESVRIIVECKRKEKKEGIDQLKSYLSFSQASLGVWFNGEEKLFFRKVESKGGIKFVEIPNIPRYGERLEDVGKFYKRDLRATHNLKPVFKTIRNHLAGNTTGATGDGALAEQLINIIFCKIYDERFTPPDEMVTFRAGIDEEPHEVTQRLRNLFDKVKEKYEEVIDFSDKINIDENSIRYIVGVLQNYSLTESERDVVADAFEIFIGHALKGSQGQFFTPRNVVKLLVEIIQPETTDSVIDPACGSGGFLIESLRYIWKKIDDQSKELGWDDSFTQAEKMSVAMKNIKGLDKDDFLVKVTKAYMAILGDGKGGVFCEDALDKPLYWREKARQSIALESFDIVLTNPPFGREVKVVGIEKLSQYELAAMWYKEGENWEVKNKQRKDVRSEIIFIERCLQLLKDGGRMGIVLPETFFHAPKSRFVMQFMERHNIQWIVDLPHNTFRPHNNAKCVVIILQKNRKQAESIKFSVAEEMGHDHQGRPIYRWDHSEQKVDKSQVWDDIQVIMDELGSESSQYTFSEDSSTVKSRSIFVPRYYWKTRDQEVSEIAKNNGYNLIPLSELVDEKAIITFDGHGSPRSEYKGKGEIPYVRVKDIVNWEIYKDPTSSIPYHVYAEMKRDKISRAGDILYVRRGSYRIGSVAMLSPFDTETLLTRELLTLRVNPHNKYGLTSHYLLYLLSHRLVAMQSFNKVLIETTLPNISDRWKELKLPFFAREEARDETILQIKSVIDAKWDAVKRLNDLKKEHGELLT